MVRIIELTIENVKRLKAVRIRPSGALVPIRGRNGQGKTSVLDAVAMALGGKKLIPSRPVRDGQDTAFVEVNLGDLRVVRRWTNGGANTYIDVFSEHGAKYPSPQAILDKIAGQFLDPLAFQRMATTEQADVFAEMVGIDLAAIAESRRKSYDQRTLVNRDIKALSSSLDSLTPPPVDTPDQEVSIADLSKELEEVLAARQDQIEYARRMAQNKADIEALRRELGATAAAFEDDDGAEKAGLAELVRQEHERHVARMKQIAVQTEEAERRRAQRAETIQSDRDRIAQKIKTLSDALAEKQEMVDFNVDGIRGKIAAAETVNAAVRDKSKIAQLSNSLSKMVNARDDLTEKIARIDAEKDAAIKAAKLPVEGMALGDGEVLFNGLPFSQASGAEQLRVSTAIAFASNPKFKVLMIRDGSLLDEDSLRLLGEMSEEVDGQILIERVGDGGEVGITIEDGEVKEK
jgi:hypothetical protein